MANEITTQTSLTINKAPISYRANLSFRSDMTGGKGPTPGAFTATIAGVDADLSELTTPGICRIQNLDNTNYVSVGIWDGSTFYPLLELLPGEQVVLRLSRHLSQEYGTGTGTTGANVNTLRIKANTASCNVTVEAFEK